MIYDYYYGIDGGLSGAITVLNKENKIEEILVMPTVETSDGRHDYDLPIIVSFFKKYPNSFAVLEKAHAMPKLGTVQAFNFGKNFGMMIAILTALNIPFAIVHSKTWQKELFRDLSKQNTKAASLMIAKRLYPETIFKATDRCTKEHDGMSDSTLIAYYASRHF